MSTELGEIWSECRLTDAVSLPTGQVDPRNSPYLQQPLLAPDLVESQTGRIIQLETAYSQGAASGKYVVLPGDVILSKIRPALRKVALANFEGTCSADMYPLRPQSRLLPEFLHALLLGERFSTFAETVSGRTGIPKVNRRDLSDYVIRFPSVSEQRRIIDVLGVLQDRIDVERAALIKHDGIWDGFLNSTLRDHEERYGRSRLIDVSQSGGGYGSNSPASPHRVGIPRYVRITDIDEWGFLSPADSAAASLPFSVARRYLLREGDLLIARTGYTTGKSYLYREGDGLCAFAGYLVRFRVDPGQMIPEYAFLWTCGNGFRGWVSRNVREVGQRNISASEYNLHEIAHPPLEVQQKLVNAAMDAREARMLRVMQINRLHTLRQALAADLLQEGAAFDRAHMRADSVE